MNSTTLEPTQKASAYEVKRQRTMGKKKVTIIGSGFSGMSAACHLATDYDVVVLEKNDTPGGRGRKFEAEGFVFDMGPSWYWMPGVFEDFFQKFGKTCSDYYNLVRLDPSYKVFFKDAPIEVPANRGELDALFESLEPGSSEQLDVFLKDAAYKYKVGMEEFVYKPSHSILEYIDLRIAKSAFKLSLLTSISSEIQSKFKHPKIIEILEFPVLFLGAKPENTPAMYSLMNYADIVLGTWYPKGGMSKIGEGFYKLACELGVRFEFNQNVEKVKIEDKRICNVITDKGSFDTDILINSADYHHFEQEILPKQFRMYNERYWENRTMAPSSLLFYMGIDKKLEGLEHHNLFFDEDFALHADEIYEDKKWPTAPLFYTCCPSKTDETVAPKGKENIFLLMPLAVDLEDNEDLRSKYRDIMIERLERHLDTPIKDHIIYERSYAINDFKQDYNSFKGNAYGLANTLKQTAILKPKLKSKKVKNLYYTGQLTTPGPGVPPSIISGEVVAREVKKQMN